MAETYGGRRVVGISFICSVISTAVVPLISDWGLWWVVAARIVTGAAAGPVYPALHNLVSLWSPPEEKGRFIASLMGGTFGTVITWSLVGLLIERLGWAYAFYVPAIITLGMTIVWYYLVHDTPSVHPRISKEERDFIVDSLKDSFSKEKVCKVHLFNL